MRTTKILNKVFLFALFLLLLSVNFSEAWAGSKAENISKLFVKVNPGLSMKTASNYAKIIAEACNKFKQDPYVIAALIIHESTVNAKAQSKGGDYGLMQIHWKAHSEAVKKKFKIKSAKGLFDARINIFYGTEIFAYCMSKSDSTRGGILRYSAGNQKLADKVLATVRELQNGSFATEKSVKKTKSKAQKGS